LSVPTNDRVLIDYRTADDAGVYRLDGERALVQTVDFFTPIVDDPDVYGRIAAANALSDVYAMGGRPLTALAIAGLPKDLDRAIAAQIFAGGNAMLEHAGVPLLGGHTVQDQEIKFGYAVTGEVHPDRVWSNGGARPGDILVFTKALGTGVIATALKAGCAPDASVAAAVASMLTLNRDASEALRALLPAQAVHACTDVTGFGLVGHVCEIAAASHVTIEIDAGTVPLLPGALDLVPNHLPAGGRTNAEHFSPHVRFAAELDVNLVKLLHDPQTSGGLLVAVPPDRLDEVRSALEGAGVAARLVGRVIPDRGYRLILM
jgi:selenide,water dikinase